MARITQQEIIELLRVYLGSAALTAQPDFPGFMAKKFTSWLYIDKTLDQMHDDLKQDLLVYIYAASGHTMKLRMDDGRIGVWTPDAIEVLTDCLMEILFYHMAQSTGSYHALLEYAMKRQSHSALKALYLYYDAYHQPRDKALIVRLITELFSPADYRSWLSPSDYPKCEA